VPGSYTYGTSSNTRLWHLEHFARGEHDTHRTNVVVISYCWQACDLVGQQVQLDGALVGVVAVPVVLTIEEVCNVVSGGSNASG